MADNKTSRSKKSTGPAPEQAFVENALQALWQLVTWLFSRLRGDGGSSRSAQKQKLAELREHWDQVELHAANPATHSLAISEADKILDNAFQVLGLSGETMGERLKGAESKFDRSLYQSIWSAHKLRNTLAHEVGAHASNGEVQQAVTAFRTALYQLGVFE